MRIGDTRRAVSGSIRIARQASAASPPRIAPTAPTIATVHPLAIHQVIPPATMSTMAMTTAPHIHAPMAPKVLAGGRGATTRPAQTSLRSGRPGSAGNLVDVTERAPLSRKLSAIAESATLKVDAKAKALQAAGRPVISYAAGEPDFATPQFIVDAAAEALRDPANFRYTPAVGLPVLREAIAAKTLRDSGLEVDASQIIVTNGGKQAVYQAFQAVVNPGDEVLLPAPYWTTYPEAIALADGVPVEVFAGADQEYKVTVEQLEAARTDPHHRARLRVALQPDRRGLHARRDPGDRRVGRRARHLDHLRRDLPEPRLRGRASGLDRRGGSGCRGPDDPRQRRREDLRDDRLARRLDGRPQGRDQGRREPAVAPVEQRQQHRAARGAGRAHRPADRGGGVPPRVRPAPQAHRRRALEDRGRRRAEPARRLLRLPRCDRACSAARGGARRRRRASSSPT